MLQERNTTGTGFGEHLYHSWLMVELDLLQGSGMWAAQSSTMSRVPAWVRGHRQTRSSQGPTSSAQLCNLPSLCLFPRSQPQSHLIALAQECWGPGALTPTPGPGHSEATELGKAGTRQGGSCRAPSPPLAFRTVDSRGTALKDPMHCWVVMAGLLPRGKCR